MVYYFIILLFIIIIFSNYSVTQPGLWALAWLAWLAWLGLAWLGCDNLCGEEKMTRMADGLYVLGDTLEALEANFREILSRSHLCGLTFKPSKVCICPVDTVLFGWKKVGAGWVPTPHTISPLTLAEPPNTVKQLRSWLGSFKQLTACIPRYATLLGPLEDLVSGRGSAAKVTWAKEALSSFSAAKKSLSKVNTVFVPKPTDILHTYSDFSQFHKAVGGRLEIHRTDIDGSTSKLLGGNFSCRVSDYQKKWYPCEGEALAVKLVLENFSGYLRESKNRIIHHTDNMPCVQAWKRSKTGVFSNSARISAFLTGISALDLELVHKPGKEMISSDYTSRHPNICGEKRCQICSFAFEMENLGDNVVPMIGNITTEVVEELIDDNLNPTVGKITVDDIEKGRINMPFTQRPGWLKVQQNDRTHQKLAWLIHTSQSPEKRKTTGENTKFKLLHGLYQKGRLQKAADGFITITHSDANMGEFRAISVPHIMFPGLIQALHLKLSHPSKLQLQRLSSRYFYSPGHDRIVEEITDNCDVCASLKQLPPEIFSESSTENKMFGAKFSADVIQRDGQKILLCSPSPEPGWVGWDLIPSVKAIAM